MNDYFVATVASGWDIDLVPKKIMINGTEGVSITEATAGVGGHPPVTSDHRGRFHLRRRGQVKGLRVFMDTPPA